MSLLAQSGYGRSDKIERAIDRGLLEGAILSPRDEARGRLERDLPLFRASYSSALFLFDPQFYASALVNPKDGHLPEYPFYANNCGLSRTHFSPRKVSSIAADCLGYQQETFGESLSFLISPTILFDGFRDSWSQIAINLAAASYDYHRGLGNPVPLLVSIAVSESAFQALDAVEEFLDAITELDVAGFYLVTRRNSGVLQHAMEPQSFAHLMYFCYVLSQINEYSLVSAYTDWHGFLLSAVGADHIASGWFQNLRQFSLARFTPSAGGRQPRPRYASLPLFANPLVIPEMEDIDRARLLNTVLSGSPSDDIMTRGPSGGLAAWTKDVECSAHWHSLSALLQTVEGERTVPRRLQSCEAMIRQAQNLYTRLNQASIFFESPTGPDHLDRWMESIAEFRRIANL